MRVNGGDGGAEYRSYQDFFTDRFAGDFGHFTPRSGELVAEAAAEALVPWLKRRFLCGFSL